MRKVYKDPMVELQAILASPDAARLNYIAVSKDEMRVLIRHEQAAEVFPGYINNFNNEMEQHQKRLKEIKIQKNKPDIFEAERQKLFDREYEIEVRVKEMSDETPSEVKTRTGLIVRVSLR